MKPQPRAATPASVPVPTPVVITPLPAPAPVPKPAAVKPPPPLVITPAPPPLPVCKPTPPRVPRRPPAWLNTTPVVIRPLDEPDATPQPADTDAWTNKPTEPNSSAEGDELLDSQSPLVRPAAMATPVQEPSAVIVAGEHRKVMAAYAEAQKRYGRVFRPDLRSLVAKQNGCAERPDGSWPTSAEVSRLLEKAGRQIDQAVAAGVLVVGVDGDGAVVLVAGGEA